MGILSQEYFTNTHDSLPIRRSDDSSYIHVYTSKTCAFCSKTLEIVRAVVAGMDVYDIDMHVIEKKVEDILIEKEDLDILTVPLTVIGDCKIIGLPREDDVKDLIHQAMLAQAFKRAI